MGMTIPEEMQEPWAFMGGKRCGGNGEKPWKKKRAVVVSLPNDVLEAQPGQTLLPAIEMRNGTHWPWKEGVFLGMDDSVDLTKLPIEVVNVPITFEVKGQDSFKLSVPIKVHEHALVSEEPFEFSLVFRGPNGNKFGDLIPMKIKIVEVGSQEENKQVEVKSLSEIEVLKLAIKLHEGIQNGQSFDECM